MYRKLLPFALFLAACGAGRSDDPPPDWIVGKYHYAESGTVAGKFPWEVKSDLILEKDGQYTLSIMIHLDDEQGGDTDTDESYGAYYVEGRKVFLEPAREQDASIPEFEVRDGRLIPKMNWATRLAMKGMKVDPVFVKTN